MCDATTTAQDACLYHEAMDRTYLLLDTFERHVEQHPVVKGDKRARALAIAISDKMAELYQLCGALGEAGEPKREAAVAQSKNKDLEHPCSECEAAEATSFDYDNGFGFDLCDDCHELLLGD